MDLMKLKALLGIPEGDTTQDIALQFLMEDVMRLSGTTAT